VSPSPRPGRRRARPALALLLAASLVACTYEESPIEDDAEVRISTTVVGTDGRPAEGAEVVLGAGATLSDLLAFSCGPLLGLCLPDGDERSEAVDEQGRAVFDLRGSDTKTLLGGKRTLSMSVAQPRRAEGSLGRGAAVALFEVESEQVALGSLVLWDTRLEVDGEGRSRSVVMGPLPPRATTASLVVEDAQGNLLVTVDGVKDGSPFDGRLLEDVPGRAAVQVDGSLEGAEAVLWRSSVWPVQGGLAPPSRGAACVRRDRSGAATVTRACGLTDGDLLTQGPRAKEDCGGLTGTALTTCRDVSSRTEVDLGSVRSVELVVLRGSAFAVPVEVSSDGRTWRPFGRRPPAAAPPAGVQVLRGAQQVRYLRWAGGEDLTEVSAW
jgi:hypothetical protein